MCELVFRPLQVLISMKTNLVQKSVSFHKEPPTPSPCILSQLTYKMCVE